MSDDFLSPEYWRERMATFSQSHGPMCAGCETMPYARDRHNPPKLTEEQKAAGWRESVTRAGFERYCSDCLKKYPYEWASRLDLDQVVAFAKKKALEGGGAWCLDELKELLPQTHERT